MTRLAAGGHMTERGCFFLVLAILLTLPESMLFWWVWPLFSNVVYDWQELYLIPCIAFYVGSLVLLARIFFPDRET